MSNDKGRVRVETNQESPRNYNVGKGEEITVKTKYEKPEVTGGGGGGIGCSLGFGEGIAGLIIVIALLFFAIRECVYFVETRVIKRINPNYVTSFERAEKEAKEKKEKKAQKEKYINDRIAAESGLRQSEKILSDQLEVAIGGREIIEKVLKQEGINFHLSSICAVDEYVWICGGLSIQKLSHPAIVFSKNGGKDWEIIANINLYSDQINDHAQFISSIKFLNKNEGFLSISKGHIGIESFAQSFIYKTNDGGRNWKIVLTIPKQMWPFGLSTISKIRIINGQYIVASLQQFKWTGTIESNDRGENWTHISIDGRKIAKTSASELIWRTEEGKLIEQ